MASTTSKMVFVQAELDEELSQQRREHWWHRKHGRHGRHGEPGKHDGDAGDGAQLPSGLEEETEPQQEQEQEQDGEASQGPQHDKNEHRGHYGHRGHRGHRGHHGPHGHHGHHHPHRHCPPPTPKGRFTNQKLDMATLLYLATLGGAHVCCLQDRIGSFAVGKAFDALYVSLDDASGNPAVWGEGVDAGEKERNERNLRRWLERFLFGGDNRNIRRVFVQGVQVGGAEVMTAPQSGVMRG